MAIDIKDPYQRVDYFKGDQRNVLEKLGKEGSLSVLRSMLTIRNFERRGEQAYQMKKVGGFYHAYTGQEAIQTAAVNAIGRKKNYYVTTYRCHALALLLGMTVEEGMCELYGKANGNAGGRGGSMHFYCDNLYGGNGIVGGQWPMGVGLGFSLKYRKIRDEIAICFGGDGSVMQGTFHESMNLAELWNIPVLMVIENNQLGMGTQIERAIANLPIGEIAKGYGTKLYYVDGMNFFDCFSVFEEAASYIQKNQKPVIIETVGYRFRGHSISDAATYRTKEDLENMMKRDPIAFYQAALVNEGLITREEAEQMDKEIKDRVVEAMKFADESPFPDLGTLEEGVYA